jgi:hypothetical protein
MSDVRRLGLTKSEVRAVMDHIWQHSRSSPNGAAFKVWERMWDFLSDDQQELRFNEKAARTILRDEVDREGI